MSYLKFGEKRFVWHDFHRVLSDSKDFEMQAIYVLGSKQTKGPKRRAKMYVKSCFLLDNPVFVNNILYTK